MTEPRKAPLYVNIRAERPADWADIEVLLNGVVDTSHWLEVDVLGCWGVRVRRENGVSVRDDDNCEIHDKVHGKFELRYRDAMSQAAHDVTSVNRMFHDGEHNPFIDQATSNAIEREREADRLFEDHEIAAGRRVGKHPALAAPYQGNQEDGVRDPYAAAAARMRAKTVPHAVIVTNPDRGMTAEERFLRKDEKVSFVELDFAAVEQRLLGHMLDAERYSHGGTVTGRWTAEQKKTWLDGNWTQTRPIHQADEDYRIEKIRGELMAALIPVGHKMAKEIRDQIREIPTEALADYVRRDVPMEDIIGSITSNMLYTYIAHLKDHLRPKPRVNVHVNGRGMAEAMKALQSYSDQMRRTFGSSPSPKRIKDPVASAVEFSRMYGGGKQCGKRDRGGFFRADPCKETCLGDHIGQQMRASIHPVKGTPDLVVGVFRGFRPDNKAEGNIGDITVALRGGQSTLYYFTESTEGRPFWVPCQFEDWVD